MTARRRGQAATDDGKAILNRIRQLVRVLRSFDRQAQVRYGLGAAQMFILHVLQAERDLSLNDLADRTATDQSSASLAAGKLVAEGYVRRTTSSEDRRQVRLSLTPKGRALVKRSPAAAQERILASVRDIPAADRTRLVGLLDRLLEGLGLSEDGGTPMLFQEEEAPARKPRR